jgi:hypothetical protein
MALAGESVTFLGKINNLDANVIIQPDDNIILLIQSDNNTKQK